MNDDATISKAMNFVLAMEGGLTNDPNDPGGLTNFGISHKAYPNIDIENLTADQARAIYLKDYWQATGCDQIASPFDVMVFDTAVNQGASKARKILQISLGVPVDGVIGQKTIAASFKAGKKEVKMFLAERLAEYIRTIIANSKLVVFAVNWSFRVASLAELVFKEMP